MLMVFATRPVLLCFARWPRSSRLLGVSVGPGSHLSSQCPECLRRVHSDIMRKQSHLGCWRCSPQSNGTCQNQIMRHASLRPATVASQQTTNKPTGADHRGPGHGAEFTISHRVQEQSASRRGCQQRACRLRVPCSRDALVEIAPRGLRDVDLSPCLGTLQSARACLCRRAVRPHLSSRPWQWRLLVASASGVG
jgi:hypothetical protein